ncbi:DNA (cytosine-5)-methyltransferase 1 [Varunaivibrio sulfuroxidans]|uniref:DNA (cytosine-5-)-methyltransferase n=2 Tax=Varunaivibrio sulfuroxidans TaxID=1773489 RepID=A0A4R3JE65_9PROT|nr:DNA (cytosine-5)-methyltransferase 1 [Varunaivibrio sulfuroxidans]
MARAGLGANWNCMFANDFDPKKASTYSANWGGDPLLVADVADVTSDQLPGHADLTWASFPCQDLSLAGDYVGLDGKRSGTFWPFWHLMKNLMAEGRGPRAIVLENVNGAITSNQGEDFRAIASALSGAKYNFGAIVIDARHWVPQSRPRLFFVGFRSDIHIPTEFSGVATDTWHPESLVDATSEMSQACKKHWMWWNLPIPPDRKEHLIDLIEDKPTGCDWHSPKETKYLVSLMAPHNRQKLNDAIATTKANKSRMVGGVYRRTRNGQQRAEIRFDNIAGCLRTPSGGSSRQTIIHVENGAVRSRLLSPREAARLMGLSDNYILPKNYNEAYHICGDGVAVPAVRHLIQNLIEPVLDASDRIMLAAAE